MSISTLVAPLLLAAAAVAPPAGSFDRTFSGDGIVITATAEAVDTADLALASGGRLVVVGTIQQRGPSVVAARYRSDGSLDPTFDGNGIAVFDRGDDPAAGVRADEFAGSVSVAADGSVRVGYRGRLRSMILGSEGHVGVATFGAGGGPATDTEVGNACQSSDDGFLSCLGESRQLVASAPDGSLVTASVRSQQFGEESETVLSVERLGGVGGSVTTSFGCCALAMAVRSDGRIILVGTEGGNVLLLRLTATLQPDPSFGAGGRRTVNLGGDDAATGVALRADGKVFVSATSSSRPGRLIVLSRNGDGTANSSFDGDGVASVPLGTTGGAEDVTIDAAGRPVVAGTIDQKFAVARFTNSGAPDATFDGDGKLTRTVGSTSAAHAVVVQGDGKIVLAGSSDGRIALLRLNG
jgi:uncharacterized delta-60 repeat protein